MEGAEPGSKWIRQVARRGLGRGNDNDSSEAFFAGQRKGTCWGCALLFHHKRKTGSGFQSPPHRDVSLRFGVRGYLLLCLLCSFEYQMLYSRCSQKGSVQLAPARSRREWEEDQEQGPTSQGQHQLSLRS